ncbi:hypothetical protein [Ruegeria sp. SCP11]|uniref:hypothetical protein n=1 Tax=Ruegeria sp. SCP11 TaxID=3141378 RepID=UPI00333D829F
MDEFSDLDACLDAEMISHTRPLLWDLFRKEAFLRPLTLAAPGLRRRLNKIGVLGLTLSKKSRQVELSLFSYAGRAHTKTSPFASFLYLGLVRSGEAKLRFDWSNASRESWLTPAAETAIRGSAGSLCGRLEHSSFHLAPSLRWIADGAECFRTVIGNWRGRIVSGLEPVRARLPHDFSHQLCQLRRISSWDDLIKVLEGLSGQETPHALAERLIHYGVIEVLPGSFGSAVLTEQESCCQLAIQRAGQLRRMEEKARAIASANSAKRVKILRDILADGGEPLKSILQSGSPVFETANFPQPVEIPEEVQTAAVAHLRHALSSRVLVSRDFARALHVFTQLFGEGGTCLDTVGFLHRLPGIIAQQDKSLDQIERLPKGRIPVTTFFQYTAEIDTESPIVLNEIYGGIGWLSAYHTSGQGDFARDLATRLHSLLRHWSNPWTLTEIIAGGSASDLQRHRPICELRIEPPGSSRTCVNSISWDALTLRHEIETNTIGVYHGERRLAPIYLGGTKPNRQWGSPYWLIALTTPFFMSPVLERVPDFNTLQGCHAQPREQMGRIITRRATWWMTAERMQRRWFTRGGAGRLVDVRADCKANGVPLRVFARRWSRLAGPTLGIELPKPLWVDLRHPLSLDLLAREIRTADAICLTEALPGEAGNTAHICEFQLETVL